MHIKQKKSGESSGKGLQGAQKCILQVAVSRSSHQCHLVDAESGMAPAVGVVPPSGAVWCRDWHEWYDSLVRWQTAEDKVVTYEELVYLATHN